LFNAPFIRQKRQEQAYINSGNYWSQIFDFQDSLPQLVLSYANRWDILGGQKGEITGWPSSRTQQYKPKPVIIQTPKTYITQPNPTEPQKTTTVNFEGMLKAFGDQHLLHLYCDLMEEFRERKIIRSSNNPVSDYGERIVAEKLNLKLADGSNKGYDAIDEKTGNRYQIKSRRVTKHNGSRQLGVIRNLDERPFDYLIAVIFDELLVPSEIWQVPFDAISRYVKFSEHQNGHILILSGSILNEQTVKRLL
jgi:hypothetical protein